MSRISQNLVKLLQIFHNLWVQLSLSQKLRGQFDPLHPSNEAPVLWVCFLTQHVPTIKSIIGVLKVNKTKYWSQCAT